MTEINNNKPLNIHDPNVLINIDRMDAKAVGLGLLMDKHFSSLVEGHTNDITKLYDHQHLLSDIKRSLTKLEEVDDEGNLIIPKQLEDKIRYYYNEFWPQAKKILNITEDFDPLAEYKNAKHPAFQSIANIVKGDCQEGPILILKKSDIDGVLLGLEDLRSNRLMNKIQTTMMKSQTCQKNSEVIFYMLMMIMSRDEVKCFIDGQRVR